jgi:hypothetical protein
LLPLATILATFFANVSSVSAGRFSRYSATQAGSASVASVGWKVLSPGGELLPGDCFLCWLFREGFNQIELNAIGPGLGWFLFGRTR